MPKDEYTLDGDWEQEISTQCTYCKHLIEKPFEEQPVCEAFRDGIPPSLWFNETAHTKAIPNDGGVRFEPRENFEDFDKNNLGAG